jgi:hypothetical protein
MLLLLLGAIWVGTAETEVVGTQPDAIHTSRISVTMKLEEQPSGTLAPLWARYRSETQIEGNGSCTGHSEEEISDSGIEGTHAADGTYRLTIPRGFFGWTCGRNVRASGARAVEMGHGMDPEKRTKLTGSYSVRRESADTTYRFRVRWSLRREN